MKLSPEERRKIYEEEKERIESEHKEKTSGASTTGLEPNVAGLLCYLAGWITGIIFLVIEQKNNFVRFHALQSIVTFGVLTVISILLGWIPFIGGFLSSITGILIFILWIILMIKAYQGELYKLPVAGNVAETILPHGWQATKPDRNIEQETIISSTAEQPAKAAEISQAPSAASSTKVGESSKNKKEQAEDSRAVRVSGYGATIFFDVVLLIFLSFFYQYIAWYHVEPDGNVSMLPLLTSAYLIWLPILVTALILSITGNIILIINDKYWLREIIKIVLNVVGVVVVVNLIYIFPFNFSVIPDSTAAYAIPIGVKVLLILIAIGLGIGALVRFITLVINISKQT